MSIREAKQADIPRIVQMGTRSLLEGPYKDQLDDNPEQTAKLCEQLISQQNAKVLVDDEDGTIAGVLAFVVFPHYFSGKITAGELIWYVEPEFRNSMIAICLLRAAERMARDLGATRMQFTAPTLEVAAAYGKLGYKQVEVSFQRTL